MQSKNFTAAEKHFNEKCLKCRQKSQAQKISFENQSEKLNELTEQNIKLKSENEQLKDWVERLIEHIDLPKEDLKILLEKKKSQKAFSDTLSLMLNFTGKYGF